MRDLTASNQAYLIDIQNLRLQLGKSQQEYSAIQVELNTFHVKWNELTSQNKYLDVQNKDLSLRVIDLEKRIQEISLLRSQKIQMEQDFRIKVESLSNQLRV